MSENAFTPGHPPKWGPNGQAVFERTYARTKPDGSREEWAETVERVVNGNVALAPGVSEGERQRLMELIYDFKILPAGRHLWASGVPGRQYLFNCHVAGWGERFSDHFQFTFLRLMEGGGVGANYSSRFLKPYGNPRRSLKVHIVCDPSHPDYAEMRQAGVLSDEYSAEWDGAWQVGDSREGWATAMVDLLDTYMADADVQHENRVYDVTNIRAKGSRIKTFGGFASGPEPFARMMLTVQDVMNSSARDMVWDYVTPLQAMEIDHAIADCVVSGGNRRSARMSIIEWDDPFVFEFIKSKSDTDKHWTTNISVAYDDRFIDLLGHAHSGARIKPTDEAYRAERVHNAVVAGMLKNGEPGYWNRSLSQEGEAGEVVSTNPCGEIALEAWENCNLGHVNLSAFVSDKGAVDYAGLNEAHRLITRFLIRATYGDVNDPKQADALARNRRIGVGHFGVQGFLAKLGIPYSAAALSSVWPGAEFLSELRSTVRETANAYAFALRIPAPIKTTTVAPTGSIAKLSGDTEGIHPVYARYLEQRIRFALTDPNQRAQLERYRQQGYTIETAKAEKNTAIAVIPTKVTLVDEVEAMGWDAETVVESADEISLFDMLAFQEMYQSNYADNAVSFTVNFPEGELTQEEAEETIARFLPVLKGTTLMPDGTRPQAPLTRIAREAYEAARVKAEGEGYDDDCANGACPIR